MLAMEDILTQSSESSEKAISNFEEASATLDDVINKENFRMREFQYSDDCHSRKLNYELKELLRIYLSKFNLTDTEIDLITCHNSRIQDIIQDLLKDLFLSRNKLSFIRRQLHGLITQTKGNFDLETQEECEPENWMVIALNEKLANLTKENEKLKRNLNEIRGAPKTIERERAGREESHLKYSSPVQSKTTFTLFDRNLYKNVAKNETKSCKFSKENSNRDKTERAQQGAEDINYEISENSFIQANDGLKEQYENVFRKYQNLPKMPNEKLNEANNRQRFFPKTVKKQVENLLSGCDDLLEELGVNYKWTASGGRISDNIIISDRNQNEDAMDSRNTESELVSEENIFPAIFDMIKGILKIFSHRANEMKYLRKVLHGQEKDLDAITKKSMFLMKELAQYETASINQNHFNKINAQSEEKSQFNIKTRNKLKELKKKEIIAQLNDNINKFMEYINKNCGKVNLQ